jgi:alkyldihydroxyacetonephosphate synthase
MEQPLASKWWGWGALDKEFNLQRRETFWPYLQEKLGLTQLQPTAPPDLHRIYLPPPAAALAKDLAQIVTLKNVHQDPLARISHAMGKSYLDLIRLRRGLIENPPDFVVYPETEAQVSALLMLAQTLPAAIIPFGGGSSVVGGVEALRTTEQVAAISLDLRLLNRLLSLDEISRVATIEAGIRGPLLEQELQIKGYTLGHYPQSFEFSSLGGWLATRSVGQQSSKYGRIEDRVVALRLATPQGLINTLSVPATATGPSLKDLLIGSEGLYGVITSAKMRLALKPTTQLYHGLLFKDFLIGAEAIRNINQAGIRVTTLRLSDEVETEAIMKMRAQSESVVETTLTRAGSWYIKKRGYTGANCLMILGVEDDEATARRELRAALAVCKDNGAIDLGERVGEHWYRERFNLPYLRDLLLDHGVMIDTLETAISWRDLPQAYEQIKQAIIRGIENFHGRPRPLVFCHISHSYPDGASLYYTFLARQAKGLELEQWWTVKEAACEAILALGATISHHHGVGRDHARWLSKEKGELATQVLRQIKQTFDPQGILNPGKFFA